MPQCDPPPQRKSKMAIIEEECFFLFRHPWKFSIFKLKKKKNSQPLDTGIIFIADLPRTTYFLQHDVTEFLMPTRGRCPGFLQGPEAQRDGSLPKALMPRQIPGSTAS